MNILHEFELLAEYNQWLNMRLLLLCNETSESGWNYRIGNKHISDIFYDMFKSDVEWFQRVDGTFSSIISESTLELNYQFFCEKRFALDKKIIAVVRSIDAKNFHKDISYSCETLKRTRSLPLWAVLTHAFNNQTFYRGQIVYALNSSGVNCGNCDIKSMPKWLPVGL